jgi:hypothetical protein
VTKTFKEVGHHVEYLVVLGDDGDLAVGWIQPPCVQKLENAVLPGYRTGGTGSGCWLGQCRNHWWRGGPQYRGGWVIEDKCFCAKWRERCYIKIKCPVEFLIHQDNWAVLGETQ